MENDTESIESSRANEYRCGMLRSMSETLKYYENERRSKEGLPELFGIVHRDTDQNIGEEPVSDDQKFVDDNGGFFR
jgi:hypothetical protein